MTEHRRTSNTLPSSRSPKAFPSRGFIAHWAMKPDRADEVAIPTQHLASLLHPSANATPSRHCEGAKRPRQSTRQRNPLPSLRGGTADAAIQPPKQHPYHPCLSFWIASPSLAMTAAPSNAPALRNPVGCGFPDAPGQRNASRRHPHLRAGLPPPLHLYALPPESRSVCAYPTLHTHIPRPQLRGGPATPASSLCPAS